MVTNHLLTGMILQVQPLKINIAPEHRSSQKEFHLPTIHFQGRTVSFTENTHIRWVQRCEWKTILSFWCPCLTVPFSGAVCAVKPRGVGGVNLALGPHQVQLAFCMFSILHLLWKMIFHQKTQVPKMEALYLIAGCLGGGLLPSHKPNSIQLTLVRIPPFYHG